MRELSVISFAKMNKSGKTDFDWNFWEEFKDGYLYFGQWSFLISRSEDTLKVGEEVLCRDNDSGRKLSSAPTKIYGICK